MLEPNVSPLPSKLWETCENYLAIYPWQPWYQTLIKVLSWATIVVPFIAHAFRTYYRIQHPISFFKFDYSRKLIHYGPYQLIIRENKKVENAEKKLDSHLQNLNTFKANIEEVVAITHKALVDIANGVNGDSARRVYKKTVAFLRHHEVDQEFPLFREFDLVVKRLRKQVKLKYHFSKVTEMANRISLPSCSFLQRWGLISDLNHRKNALDCLNLTWLHGTKAFTLDSARKVTANMIVPTGELRENQVVQLTGEMVSGTTARGVNQRSLSGVALLNAKVADDYARANKLVVEIERGSYESLLQTEDFDDINHFSDFFSNQVEAVRRIQYVHPEKVEQDKGRLKDIVKKLYLKIKTEFFDKGDARIHTNDTFAGHVFDLLMGLDELETILRNTNKPTPIDANSKLLAQIPVVVASSTIFGGFVGKTNVEEIYPGSLEIGRDLKVVFTEGKYHDQIASLVPPTVIVKDLSVLRDAITLEKGLRNYFYNYAL